MDLNNIPQFECPILDFKLPSDEWEKKIEWCLSDNDIISYLGYMEEWFLSKFKDNNIPTSSINPFDNEESEKIFEQIFNEAYINIEPILNEAEYLLEHAAMTQENQVRWENLDIMRLCTSVRVVRNQSALEVTQLLNTTKLLNTNM